MAQEKFVLVVEDDPFYSKIYKTKLGKENIHAEIVSNGNEAIKLSREKLPSLVLLDLIMPGKDGFETLAEFKADPALKSVPIIVLSNLSQEEDIKKVIDLGAAEYLIKANVPIRAVIEKVKNNLGA